MSKNEIESMSIKDMVASAEKAKNAEQTLKEAKEEAKERRAAKEISAREEISALKSAEKERRVIKESSQRNKSKPAKR